MRILKLLCKLIIIVLIGTLEICWSAFLFLIDLIDGEEEEILERSPTEKVWFNYRTGETDPFRRPDGLYDISELYDDNW